MVAPTGPAATEVTLPFTDLGVAVNSSSVHSGLDINGKTSEEARTLVRVQALPFPHFWG